MFALYCPSVKVVRGVNVATVADNLMDQMVTQETVSTIRDSEAKQHRDRRVNTADTD